MPKTKIYEQVMFRDFIEEVPGRPTVDWPVIGLKLDSIPRRIDCLPRNATLKPGADFEATLVYYAIDNSTPTKRLLFRNENEALFYPISIEDIGKILAQDKLERRISGRWRYSSSGTVAVIKPIHIY